MDFINLLLNQPIIKIGRASDLCWMVFGKSFMEKDALGKTVERGEYSLHLQCPWRLCDSTNYTIKLASGDIYEPRSSVEWDEDFDWDVQGNNLFDEKVEYLFPKETSAIVRDASVSAHGDLQMIFSNMLMLECFVNVSTNQECWRFFKHGEKKHWVICGNGKEFQ